MGLFDDLFGNDKKKSQEAFGLFSFINEQEKEEVKKGNYDPWNFEEEDLEEDDYYSEDDE